ncbi:MAG: L,D-transpeptidase family protein, partial [Gammaproteobacteria bacterium]|nr:L,D-transpeptidase family protein [Gammaproteobacteria bacterium]
GLANDGAFRPELEILATDALARLAFHLHFGKVNPEQLEPTWNFTRSMAGISPVNAMARLVNAEDLPLALDALAPQLPRYTALVDALATYRAIADQGGWPTVPAGPTLRPGDRSPRVAALRDRLHASGGLDAAAAGSPDAESDADGQAAALDEDYYDADLERAVRLFQRRHALTEDAIVGPRTLAALNVSVESRIDQLRVNIERVRWVFRDLGPRYVIANIARFRVSLIEDGESVWETRAVVGRSYRQTPVFRSNMRYLVFNPTWTVPPGILARDLLPEIRRDPETLTRRNMVVLDLQGRPVDASTLDWQALPTRGFPYMIRQQPGPDNALGQVKFMYPNPYHVYMHDTPARNLFGETDRAFSSGCVRLDNPLEFARILLADSPGWDDAGIARVIAEGRQRTVNLPQPLPVLTIYATAVPENGEVLFLPDVYSRDNRLLAALNEGFRFSPPEGYEESLHGTL